METTILCYDCGHIEHDSKEYLYYDPIPCPECGSCRFYECDDLWIDTLSTLIKKGYPLTHFSDCYGDHLNESVIIGVSVKPSVLKTIPRDFSIIINPSYLCKDNRINKILRNYTTEDLADVYFCYSWYIGPEDGCDCSYDAYECLNEWIDSLPSLTKITEFKRR